MKNAARLSRRRFLLGAVSAVGLQAACLHRLPGAAASSACQPPVWKSRGRASLTRAHAWLWDAQSSDGRFPSVSYGLLASGQSLTPFALESLLFGPPELLSARGREVARAIDAMIRMRDESGALGFGTPSPDYPCYATGLLLSCLAAARPGGWRELAGASIDWLRTQQLRAGDGWAGHSAQGGWGMGSRRPRRVPNAGHVDLSMTRRVALGLRAVGVRRNDPALIEARDFVARCQTTDGSFVYSPVELALNKGLRTPDGSPRGYGSATTDGLLAMAAVGVESEDALERGLRWLHQQHRVDRNPGLEGGPMAAFGEAMCGYYRAGAARCFARWGGPEGWREQLVTAIVAEQHPDGSFRASNGLQKEDDPIIATAFAVQALAAALSAAPA